MPPTPPPPVVGAAASASAAALFAQQEALEAAALCRLSFADGLDARLLAATACTAWLANAATTLLAWAKLQGGPGASGGGVGVALSWRLVFAPLWASHGVQLLLHAAALLNSVRPAQPRLKWPQRGRVLAAAAHDMRRIVPHARGRVAGRRGALRRAHAGSGITIRARALRHGRLGRARAALGNCTARRSWDAGMPVRALPRTAARN